MNQGRENHSSKLIWILAVCCFILGSTQQYLMGVPVQIAADVGVSLSAVSLLMTVFALVNALFAPVFVIATSKYSLRNQLVISMLLVIAGLLVMGTSNNFTLLLIARGVMGVGNGAFVATAYSFAQKLAEPGKQATALANVTLGFSAASVLSMPIARALRDTISWHWAYLALAVLAIVGIVVIRALFPDTKLAGGSASLKERMSPLANRAVVLAFCSTFFMFTSFASFYTYITPFIDTTMPELGSASSILLFAIGIMSLIGTKMSGVISDALGVRVAIVASLALQAVALVLVLVLVNSGFALIPLLLIWMFASWMFMPVQNVLLTHLAKEGASMALSLSNSFLQFGNAFGAVIAGGMVAFAPVTMLPVAAVPLVALAFAVEMGAFKMGNVSKRAHR